MQNYTNILNKPTLKKMRPDRESTPFTFNAYLQDIISEDERIFKLTTGSLKISGWTRHRTDCDIDTVSLVFNGKCIDIKPQLEYLGAMKKVDEAAKTYIRRHYYSQLKAV